MFQDRVLTCRMCGAEFVFSAADQAFYAQRGFENLPARCPDCRRAQKTPPRQVTKQMYDAVCAGCGKDCQVPFAPTGSKPVYCGECFKKAKGKK